MIKAAIITAAGASSRMKDNEKKELKLIRGKTVLERAVLPFVLSREFDYICITYPQGKKEDIQGALAGIDFPFRYVRGGETRQASVYNALMSLKDTNSGIALIHDGARPHIDQDLIRRVLEGTVERGNSIPVIPSVSAMKILGSTGEIKEHLVRNITVCAQTPQGFTFPGILKAHEKASRDKHLYIDDSEIWSSHIGPSFTVAGDPGNIKITYPEDFCH